MLQSGLLASISGTRLSVDWTAAFAEDVSPMLFYYALGTVDDRGSWDVLDWCDLCFANAFVASQCYFFHGKPILLQKKIKFYVFTTMNANLDGIHDHRKSY